jgi:DNA mismatch repair protein MutS
MSLVKEYFQLTNKYQSEYGENTILLMQVGAFFEVYGLDAEDGNSPIAHFSRICELNVVEKNTCVGENNIVMAGFKDFQIEKYLKKIQEAGFTAVVYTQDENAKHTSRSLAGVFSPGTFFHTDSSTLSNSTTCIWIDYVENKVLYKGKHVVVGIANIDIYTGKTSMFQFQEQYVNSPTTYDELERFISIYNPSEVILISNLPEEKEMEQVISYAGISCLTIHKIYLSSPLLASQKATHVCNCEKQSYQKEILSKFYRFDHFDLFVQQFNENTIATQALCYLLDFLYQHNPHLVNKIAEPVFENTSKRLTLANHSLKQLNIIHDGNIKPSKYSCVSQMLNECSTAMGKRTFLYNMLNPICDTEDLTVEYDITEYVMSVLPYFEHTVRGHLLHIKDLSKFERQVFLKKITPKSFATLHGNIQRIADIFAALRENVTIMNYLKRSNASIEDIGTICENVLTFIAQHLNLTIAKDLDQYQQFETNCIQYGVDAELDKKTEALLQSESTLEAIRAYLSQLIEQGEKKAAKGKSTEYVKIHETEKNNYSMLCTSRRCKLLEEALPSKETEVMLHIHLVHGEAKEVPFVLSKGRFSYEKQSSANNFITDAHIHSLCKSISSTKISMKDHITLVYHRFIEAFGSTFQQEITRISQFVTMVDVLYTKASIAKKYNYCKPRIDGTAVRAFVEAKGLRHCLIEQFQFNELYVTNDVSLGGSDGADGILLYGTNAVGKTTLIRALGIAVILAQAGLFVPCTSFVFKPYRHIFTRIIGNDNIFKGLSTFEVEMSELRTILRLMDADSLVLGDELCSGTETISAVSIFVAGIQRLYHAKSSFIFATHLHEIVDYEEITALETVRLKHMEVAYNKEKDMLVYDRKLKDGPGANMYGLEVCKSLQLPSDFLDAANEIRLKYNHGGEGRSILSLKPSRYNAQKIVSLCELCGKHMGTEVHHLQHQADANEDGMIATNDTVFHKNHVANLMTLCEKCHLLTHKKGTTAPTKRVKTSKGYKTEI